MAASEPGATTATITLNGGQHGQPWWYAETAMNPSYLSGQPFQSNCHYGGVSKSGGSSIVVDGLVPGNGNSSKSYTFTAYSDSACTLARAMGSVNADTLQPTLSANALGGGGARLTLGNWGANDPDWHYRVNVVVPHSGNIVLHGANGCAAAPGGALQVDVASLPPLSGNGAYYIFTAYSASGCHYSKVTAYAKLGGPQATPSLSVSDVTNGAGTLAIANHPGTWYYKADAGPDATCQGPVHAATAALTGLTANRVYLYTAYGDSGCASANALASAYLSASDVAVGNLGETRGTGTWSVGGSDNVSWANAFTTGGYGAGYTLEGVTLDFAAKTNNPGSISVALHAADTGNGSNPASSPVTNAALSGSDPDAAGLQTYACSGSGCDLTASTTYFIVTSVPTGYANGSYEQRNTTSDDESLQSPATGWSIANAGRSKTGANAWTAAAQAAVMHVAADRKKTLSTSDVRDEEATLTVAGHSGQWWYKATAGGGPHATCQGPVAAGATSVYLTGLTGNSEYTYGAYSAAGCASASELATKTFRTVGFTNSEVEHTSAIVTLSDYGGDWWVKKTSGPGDSFCLKAAAGSNSFPVTSLNPNTSYTYKAYTNSNCTAASEIGTTTFTTTPPQNPTDPPLNPGG